MTFRRLAAALIAAGITCASFIISTPAAAESGQSLLVSPGQQAFDVSLSPGDEAVAPITLENRSSEDLSVALSPILTETIGNPRVLEALKISAHRVSECSVDSISGASGQAMSGTPTVSLGSIRHGERIELCIHVSYPVAAAMSEVGTAIVDFGVTGISTGSRLSRTGSDFGEVFVFLLVGASLILVGAAMTLGILHHRRTHVTRKIDLVQQPR